MVHTAYDSVELVSRAAARVDTLACYGSKILAGCSDAALRIYAPQSPSEEGILRESYTLDRTVNGFWRRPPLAMEVSTSRDLLLSLSEWITSHRLPNLETVAAISKTKGANVFAWDDRRGMMCVGRQKRITIYRLGGGREFVEVKELSVPDVVKSMAWCGENICLGIRREYLIVNSATGTSSEIFPSGRSTPPLVIPLPSGELLLGKDNIGVILDQNGKLLQDGRVCWSEAPGSVVIHTPYAIARLPRYIEIRSLRAPYSLVQTVLLRDSHLLVQSGNCVIAAAGNSIHGLLPVPLGAQIVQLTASGDFEEALALCKLLPPEDSNLRMAKEGSIRMRYGHYLFDNGSYEEALDQFLASHVDITYVISLYPSIVLPKTSENVDHDDSASPTDRSHHSRASSDASDESEPSSPTLRVVSDEKNARETWKMSYNSLMALVKYLQKKRPSIVAKAVAEVTEEVVLDVVHSSDSWRPKSSGRTRGSSPISSVAREMAAILDTALLQSLLLTEQSASALELLKGPSYCDLKISREFLQKRGDHIVLLELYKCNEMHRDALKLLVQLVGDSTPSNSDPTPNFSPDSIIEYLKPLCSKDPILVLEFSMHVLDSRPTQTIELFLSGNIPADLVNSYLKQHAPSLQPRYLELMLSLNESGVSPNLQNELVQIYLSEVIEWYRGLKNQEKWDEKSYSPTRKKLLSTMDCISGHNAELLLNRLPLDALFEERAILLGRMNQHQKALSLYVYKLHSSELAVAYCDHVYQSGLQQSISKSSANIYHTLLQIYLSPSKAAKDIELRAPSPMTLMNSVQQRSGVSKAKGIRSSKKIVEIEGATDDIRVSPSSTDSGRSDGDVEEIEGDSGPVKMDEALDLLCKRWDRMNGAHALKLLPRSTKLQCLLPFLGPLLRKSSEGCRNYSIIKNLRYSENMQVKEEIHKHQKTGFKIDADSTCAFCRKKIGSSVFVIYPDRKTFVHFVCFRDSQRLRP